jgi:diketogulonate reductase-like aldo/keto reductase
MVLDRPRIARAAQAAGRAEGGFCSAAKGRILAGERDMEIKRSPLLTLNNGIQIPALGLGVFLSTREETASAVEVAIASGYRLIDTAAAYMNERQVGEGIARSGVARSELVVQTKLWVTDYGYDRTLHAFDVSLRKLGLDYVDVYLLHWPVPTDFESTVASYRAAEKLLAERRVRAIGVCNFSPKHLESLMARTAIVPALNQVELHPLLIQRELRAFHARHGIVTQAWSPIGGASRRRRAAKPDAAADPLEHPVLAKLAAKYKKTPAQVVLRWHIEHGVSAIPKSVHRERIVQNIDIFDFRLTAEEVAAIDALDTGVRGGSDPERVDAKTFPIVIDE